MFLSDVVDANEEDRKNLIAQAGTALGNCATPVTDFLMSYYISKQLEKKQDIDEKMEALLYKTGLQDYITKWKLNKLPLNDLYGNEHVEKLDGLLNAVFLKDANNSPNNKCPIDGVKAERYMPSVTRYIDAGFMLVTEELVKNFAKLVCNTSKNGELVKNENNHYIADYSKLDRIKDLYINSIGIKTPVQKMADEFENKYTTLLQNQFEGVLEDYNNPLIDIKALKEKLTSKLSESQPNERQGVYEAFFASLKDDLIKWKNDNKRTINQISDSECNQ